MSSFKIGDKVKINSNLSSLIEFGHILYPYIGKKLTIIGLSPMRIKFEMDSGKIYSIKKTNVDLITFKIFITV